MFLIVHLQLLSLWGDNRFPEQGVAVGFQVGDGLLIDDGRQLLSPPKPPTLKSQSLLAYLVLYRDRPHSRERLADLYWGDRPERKAHASLSTALWHLRRCLPNEALILSDPHSVQFDPQADLWIDVDEFES